MEVRTRLAALPLAALVLALAPAGVHAQELSPEMLALVPPEDASDLCREHGASYGVAHLCADLAAPAPAEALPLPPPALLSLPPVPPLPIGLPLVPTPPLPVAEAAPLDPRWRLSGELDATLVGLAALRLDGSLALTRALLHGAPLAPDDARAAHRHAAALGRADALVREMEDASRAALLEALAPSGARGEGLRVTLDRDSLSEERTGEPLAARVHGDVLPQVPRSEADLRKAGAALRAGATLTLGLALQAPAGTDLAYRVRAPEGLVFAGASHGDLSPDGRVVILRLDNAEGAADLSVPLSLALEDPSAARPAAEDVRASIDVQMGAWDERGVPLALDVTLALRALDVAARFPGALPADASLDVLGADGLRALHAAGALPEEDLAAAEVRLLDALAARLGPGLEDFTISGSLSREDLREEAEGSPVRFHARAEGRHALPPGEARRADLALALGATLALDVPLPEAPVADATFVLRVPPGLALADGTQAARLESAPEGSVARLLLRKADSPRVERTDAQVLVRVDVKGVEVDSGRLLSGGDPRLVMEVTAATELRAVELPPEARASLDPRVELTHLTSDGLRLLRREGLLTDADLAQVEARLLEGARKALRDALGGDAPVTGGFVASTLAPEAEGPVAFEARALVRAPVRPPAPDAKAALALHAIERSFVLPRLGGLDTEYAILLPPGIELSGLRLEGGDATPQRVGGRDLVILRPDDERMTAHATVTLTSSYVLASHGMVLYVLFVTLLLLVEAPIAALVLWRAHRRSCARKAAASPRA